MMTKIKTPTEIVAMRESGKMTAAIVQMLKERIKPGISTKDLAVLAAAEIKAYGARSAFLGYMGYPDVILVSINDEVVHGIPRADKIIADGDIVKLDFGVQYQGMITDHAITTIAGKPKHKRHQQLVTRTLGSLEAGIFAVRDGVRTGDIGAAVQAELDQWQYGIVRDLVGHGVGHSVHEEPDIPNYGKANTGTRLVAGMTIAIEPMATLGNYQVYVADDEWTILTTDGSMAAHFEHTVLITAEGAEILTTL